MPPAKATPKKSATKAPKTSPKKSAVKTAKEKKRPTLNDVVEQLISLQGFGITQDSSLLQICDGNDTQARMAFSPIDDATIGPIIGVDEAGRGCLAGPVVAAAVILPSEPFERNYLSQNIHDLLKSQISITPYLESLGLGGLADSKKLSEAQRDALAPLIRQHALAWGLGVVWPQTIDKVNILQATFLAMARAVNNIRMQASLMLIDGNKTIPAHAFTASQAFKRQFIHAATIDNASTQQHAVVGGDDIVPAISAASILAKTYRDKLMVTFNKHYPAYGFSKHKGYGTKDHLAALAEHGPCVQHRLTFRGVVLPKDEPHMQDSTPQDTTSTPLRLW